MSFAENLQLIRKERHLTQEDLADHLNVSRQTVSKWEQGAGYPEVGTLLLLSKKLNVSLDYLMSSEAVTENTEKSSYTGTIQITSPFEGVVVSCYKVSSSPMFKAGKDEPKFALFGISGASFWGENTTFLGWYASREDIQAEIGAISKALSSGVQAYELKFSVKTERKWLKVKIVQ